MLLKHEAPGFIGNHLKLALLRKAFFIVELESLPKKRLIQPLNTARCRLATTDPLESAVPGNYLKTKVIFLKVLGNSVEVSPILKEAIEKGNLGSKRERVCTDGCVGICSLVSGLYNRADAASHPVTAVNRRRTATISMMRTMENTSGDWNDLGGDGGGDSTGG
ncbi:MAG: hypothetical protein A4E53_03224 [Pelotomaculum sp. PtaB.Bin104]|nr:MAG: hypothetical protein A4E53_03224 [Pelotomaculum sp. PtaB.Bin104]